MVPLDTRCVICGNATRHEPQVCSERCRLEAEDEMRRNRERIRRIRRGRSLTGSQARELRGLFDRTAELGAAIADPDRTMTEA